jgi:hypothetical protein
VRLWKWRSFILVAESRVLGDDRPIDTIRALVRKSGLDEAVATTDWHDGSHWSGFVYLNGNRVNVIQFDEIERLLRWPEFDNYGPRQ